MSGWVLRPCMNLHGGEAFDFAEVSDLNQLVVARPMYVVEHLTS